MKKSTLLNRLRSSRVTKPLAAASLACVLCSTALPAVAETLSWGALKSLQQSVPDSPGSEAAAPAKALPMSPDASTRVLAAAHSDERFGRLAQTTGRSLDAIEANAIVVCKVPFEIAHNDETTLTLMPARDVLYVLRDVEGETTAFALRVRHERPWGLNARRHELSDLEVLTVTRGGAVVASVSPWRCFAACTGGACVTVLMDNWWRLVFGWQALLSYIGLRCGIGAVFCALGCF